MANKKKSQAPVISDLPIKTSETPLVIDLPDGQKLVVGKLTTGSVIEVATWRGTGRPDSRTSRLMLGMSDASASPANGAPSTPDVVVAASQEKVLKPWEKINLGIFGKFLNIAIGAIAGAIKWIREFPAVFRSLKENGSVSVAEPYREDPVNIEDDVSEWLNQITAKAEASRARKEAKAAKQKTAKKTTSKAPIKRAVKKKSR